MNFTKKLLLSAALIIGVVTAGFAQNTTEIGTAEDYSVWVSSDGKTIWSTTDSEDALFGISKAVGAELSEARLVLFLPNNGINGSRTVYFTVDGGATFKKAQLTFKNGFANVTSLVKMYTIDDLIASAQVAFAIDGKVYVLGNKGFMDGINILENYNPNPFGTINDNPFGPTTQNFESWTTEFGLEHMNPYDLHSYIRVFVEDAKYNFGLNFDYIYDYDVNIEFNSQDEHILESPSTIAYTNALGNDKVVNIIVNPVAWANASPAKRLAIIYHELGHDILNLTHKAEEGPLMSVYARSDFSFEDLYELRVEMFNDYKNEN